MRENARAWCPFFLFAADTQVRARQSELDLRGRHARQLHAHRDDISRFTKVDGRRPCARSGRSVRQRRLLQRIEETPHTVAQPFQFEAFEPRHMRRFYHMRTMTSDELKRSISLITRHCL